RSCTSITRTGTATSASTNTRCPGMRWTPAHAASSSRWTIRRRRTTTAGSWASDPTGNRESGPGGAGGAGARARAPRGGGAAGGAGRGGDRPAARQAVGQAPAHRPDAVGGSAVLDPPRHPVRGGGGHAGDLGIRAAEPVALLVGPRDGRHVDRRRGSEPMGGDRLRPRRPGRGRELRVEPGRG